MNVIYKILLDFFLFFFWDEIYCILELKKKENLLTDECNLA